MVCLHGTAFLAGLPRAKNAQSPTGVPKACTKLGLPPGRGAAAHAIPTHAPWTDALPRAMAALDTTTRIQAPELLAFDFELAGPWRRAWAYGLDLILRGGAFAGAVIVLLTVTQWFSSYEDLVQTHEAFMLLLWFALEWGYHVLFEWLWGGRTPGKKVLHLRVLKTGGYPIGLQEAVLRNLLRAADLLPALVPGSVFTVPSYLTGTLVSAVDPLFRRLGDHVADTMVICDRPRPLPWPREVVPPIAAAERLGLPQRPQLSLSERQVLAAFCHRWHEIGEGRRDEIALEFATLLADRWSCLLPASPARFLQVAYQQWLDGQSALSNGPQGPRTAHSARPP